MDNLTRYNELMEVVKARYSCRAYRSDKPVDAADVERVLEAVRIAPSACNRQPWKFLVLTAEADRAAVAATYGRPFPAQAPVLIVALGLHNQAWHRAADGKDHTDVDVAIAVEHLTLAAAALGLATCWICNFDAAALRSALGLEGDDDTEPIAIIPLGHAADAPADKKRKTLAEIAECRDC